jgi:hypothetical protein
VSSRVLWSAVLAATMSACFAGTSINSGSGTRNGSTASLVTARPQAGGNNEGPLGFAAAMSRSHLYEGLAAKGIKAETLGPLNEIKDSKLLLSVMDTFTRSLGVRCSWCHIESDYSAATARKAVAAFMWDTFVAQLQLADGSPLYCDSCHHQSTVFLPRDLSDKHWVAKYMETEYVDALRHRDGASHGCATCHGTPFNPRFLPRIDNPKGYAAPAAQPGIQP